jgi:hypothetical protein
MIKKREEWTFTEHQSYAKGFLEGIVFGLVIAALLACIGMDIYYLFR